MIQQKGTDTPVTVLVTGSGGGVGQGILKALRLSDLNLRVIAADLSPLAPGLYTADQARLVPAVKDPEYVDKICALCREEGIDFYIPGTDMELLLCAENREYFQAHGNVEVVVSPHDVIEISDDKYKTSCFLRDNALPYPVTHLQKSLTDEIIRTLDYPLIVKPRVGFRSVGVYIVQNESSLRAHMATSEDIIVQEIAGEENQEYTCTIVGAGDELSPPVILRRDLRSGDTYRAFSVENSVIGEYVTSAAKALDIKASCNFQLRQDASGIPRIFEINGRFSGTTPFCAQLGMNPVEFYLKSRLGIPYAPIVRTDLTILRAWSEIVVGNSQIEMLGLDQKMDAPGVQHKGVL